MVEKKAPSKASAKKKVPSKSPKAATAKAKATPTNKAKSLSAAKPKVGAKTAPAAKTKAKAKPKAKAAGKATTSETSPVLSMSSYVAWSKTDPPGTIYEIPQSALHLLNLQAPKGALLTLFGSGGSRDGMGAVFPLLAQKGLFCRPVLMSMPITYEPHIRVGIVEGDALLPSTNFLHLSRIRSDLRALIRSLWIEICQRRGLPNDQVETSFPAKPTAYPQWIGDLLDEPRLKHIKTLAFPVSTSAGDIPVVAVFQPKAVAVLPVAGLDGKVQLPKL